MKQLLRNQQVGGSSPPVGSNLFNTFPCLQESTIGRERPSKAKLPRMARGIGEALGNTAAGGMKNYAVGKER
jgi:hypothetical protein